MKELLSESAIFKRLWTKLQFKDFSSTFKYIKVTLGLSVFNYFQGLHF